MTEQLLQDLHALLGEVDVGWCAYARFGTGDVKFGIGGCLVEQMVRVTGERGIAAYQRQEAMTMALGFTAVAVGGPKKGQLVPAASDMFNWNDAQRDPDVIKRRIKDAIEGLNVST